ncbi:MAG TPA: Holliday junction resolvase RuvX [Candidatus Paceibacterota bacterium]|jgi:putative Holliday junction resolvase|nr:Holliday junction resolvase RuvX [Candidatus Paceibacterota bacterium]
MRYLGIDFGSKRVGIAVSDEEGTMAFPKAVLENTSDLAAAVKKICEENGVEKIILGESKNYRGEYNPIMEKGFVFKEELARETGLPVELEPEFLTSAQAERGSSPDMLDAGAAALILQSFLDRINK